MAAGQQIFFCETMKLTETGDTRALLVPSRDGWVHHPGIPGELWAFFAYICIMPIMGVTISWQTAMTD